MSKAQYILLVIFIGFYGLLFTYLLMRAFAGIIGARLQPVKPAAVERSARRAQLKRHRPWTAAL